MDYFGILKKAWNITWKYKTLWVLGLFAGATSSGSTGNNSYRQSGDQVSGSADQFTQWATNNVALIAIIVGVLVVIGFAFWVLSIAAQGGLVHGANEAAEGRTPSLRASWGVGFSKWGRTLMIGFMLSLPVIAVVLVMTVLFVILGLGGATAGEEAVGAAVGVGVCVILPLFVVVIIAVGLIIGIVYQLALRYGVLQDVTFGQAIKRGWNDLWAKRGAFVMWLVMLLPGLAAGVAMLILMLPFMLPAIALIVAEKYIIAGALFVLMAIVMMLPTAIYGTFVSSAWTVFFREMSGMEPRAAAQPSVGPSYAPPVVPPVQAPLPPSAEPAIPAEVSAPAIEAPTSPSADAGFAAPAPAVPATPDAPPAEETPPGDV